MTMRNKKKPKKPISKATLSLNAQLARQRGIKNSPKRFLIVCEDTKSSVNYFKALRKHLKISPESFEVVPSGGLTQPIQVVNLAIERKKKAAAEDSGTLPFDEVWCVIDGDYGPKIPNARKKAEAHQIELAISTKCFEYWILLHFEENDTSTMNCDELISSLKKKHLRDYEKGSYNFSQIVNQAREACKRAKKLREPGMARGDLPERQNPCSEVYLLVTKLVP